MKDERKTKAQLISELKELRRELDQKTKIETGDSDIYSFAMDNLNYGVFLLQEGTVIFSNNKAQEATGFSSEELKKINYIDIFHPDDRKYVLENKRRREKGEPVPPFYTIRYKHFTGEYHYCRVMPKLINYENKSATLVAIEDLCEKPQNEIAMMESQEKFHGFYQKNPLMLQTVDTEGRITSVNKEWLKVLGYTEKEIIGKNIENILSPDNSEEIKNEFRELIAEKGFVFEIPHKFIKKDGSVIETLVTTIAEKDKKGNINKFFSVIVDINERIKAQQELRRFENLLKSTIDSIRDYIFVVNKGLKIEFLNNSLEKLSKSLGYEEDLRGKDISRIVFLKDFVNPADYNIVFEKGKELRNVITMRVGTDEYISEVKKTPIFENYNVTKVITTISDITDFLRAEKLAESARRHLEKLINTLPDSIWSMSVDSDGTIIDRYYSPVVKNISGYDSDYVEENLEKIVHPDDVHKLEEIKERILKEKPSTSYLEYRFKKPDGTFRWVAENGMMQYHQDGTITINGILSDIHEKKITEIEKKETEKTFRQILDTIPDLIMLKDKDSRIVWANKAVRDVYNITNEELIGTYDAPHVSSELTQKYIEDDKKVIETGKSLEIDEIMTGWDGKQHHYFTIKEPIFDSKGNVVNILAVGRDISERSKAEKELRESEQRFRLMAENVSDIVWIKDLNLKTTYISSSIKGILGFEPHEALNNREISNNIIDKDTLREIKEEIKTHGTKGEKEADIRQKTWRFNRELRHKDESSVWTENNISFMFDKNGETVGVIGVMRDVTQRVEYEIVQKIVYEIAKKVTGTENLDELLISIKTLLNEVLDTTNFFVAFYDSEEDILTLPFFVDSKDKFRRAPAKGTITSYMIHQNTPMLLYKEQMEEMSEKGIIDIVGSPAMVWLGCPINLGSGEKGAIVAQNYENRDTFTKKHLDILKFVSGQIELAIQRKRHEEEMHKLISELHNSNKTMEQDAITLMELNQKLTESEKELKLLNETKDKFFSIISHDLKNPFNVMVTLTNYLDKNLDKMDAEDLKNSVKDLKNSTRRSFELLKNLLEWSRSQTGKIKFEPKEISLHELVISSVYLMKMNADKKKIKLQSEVDSDLTITADYNMLETIIRNLISNAVKFTHEGGSVTVKSYRKDKDVKIVVEDTGVGISNEDKEKLFRIDVSHTTVGTGDEKGTGLGLILCREFAEKHGGNIEVESEIGKGSKFIITLPA